MVGELLLAWVTIAMLYLASAIHIAIVWREDLPDTVWLLLFSIGAAIFVAINQRYLIPIIDFGLEVFLLVVAAGAWALALTGIRAIVIERRRLLEDTETIHP